MRTLTISKNTHFMRFFLWAWKIDSSKLNICKLFWGTLFFPVGIVVSRLATTVQKAYLGFPWLVIAGSALAFGIYEATHRHWGLAIFHLSMAFALLSMFFLMRKICRKEPDEQLSAAVGIGSRLSDWFAKPMEVIFEITSDIQDAVQETETAERVSGWFGVVRHYIHSRKERICPHINVA